MFNKTDFLAQLSASQRTRVLALEGAPLEPVFDARTLPDEVRTTIAEADRRLPQSLQTNPKSFEEIADLIAPGTVYVSHPVFVGPPISIWISKQCIYPAPPPRDDTRHWGVEKVLRKRTEALVKMRYHICGEFGGDSIRLDGRIVRHGQGQADDIDIYRCVVFDGSIPIAERPHHERIFCQDDVFDLIFAFPNSQNSTSISRQAKSASAAFLDENGIVADGYEGMLWVPLRTDRHLPSVFMEPDAPMSRKQAQARLRKLAEHGYSGLRYVRGW